ncbi:predicted protein [Chaetomium globosum CBS 148.51]|uniref:Cyanovirin-N domain-containing protein n=1 Tax=Chaetomium globosum (strain ATCC 6205 / CBS 148.51 / DSM 1962 / NBRC 6347 / NRRL 1970) TaxID=306901 RepID=Q2GZC3_CHAGB|nr:uncharacterized protein CHGG_05123 [Chaetomium globosum CBS 148.51]EAQ88504.1 predicted protein [Chaetomium globosum CBS 148.51]
MHLAVPIQLFIVALAATQSSASPPAAPISNGVETRTAHGAVEKRSFWNVHRMLYRWCHRQPFVDVGNYGYSCQNTQVRECDGVWYISAVCTRVDGENVVTATTLTNIHNRDDLLVCDGF